MAVIHDSQGRGIGSDNPLAVRQIQSDIIVPMDVQSHYQQTIQTHNAVSVGSNTSSNGAWIDSDGFDKIGLTLVNDAATSSYIYIDYSTDGITIQGQESGIFNSTSQRKATIIDTKLRYFRIGVVNADTIAHTMSAWIYLKA